MELCIPLAQMSTEDKLRALEEIWADLSQKDEQVPVPAWHKTVLEARERLVREGKAQFLDWETAKMQIKARLA